jgi:hypothetical protein
MAAFCRYWRLTPAEVDDLGDEVWAAMVRFMQADADAVKRAQREAAR